MDVVDDGLPCRKAGPWVRDKLAILGAYLHEFSTICRKRAPGWYYIDGLAGSGLNRIEEEGGALVPGSALVALETSPAFSRCLLMEYDADNAAALQQRTARHGDRAFAVQGDVNVDLLPLMYEVIPRKAPVIAVLDPEGIEELHWSTVTKLSRFQTGRFKTELLILLNLQGASRILPLWSMQEWAEEKLDRFFPSDWRGVWEARQEGRLASPEDVRRELMALYQEGLGDGIGARAVYEELAADRFSALPRDSQWLLAMSLISPVCAAFADVERAEILYGFQLPYAARHAFVHEGNAGSVSRALGILATVLGRLEDAERHFEDALEMNRRMGARPWVAYTQHDYAKMLFGRDAPGDREAAVELLRQAEGSCAEVGMVALGRKVADLLGAVGVPADPASVSAMGPGSTGTFRREGEYWSIGFDGDAFRLRDSKGLRYLAHLLAIPGREIHALELVAAVEGRAPGPGRADPELVVDAGDAGEALDARAKAEYRARLTELESELTEAEDWNDPERASRLREEIDFLARELGAAVGLGGRDRKAASNAERARVNVTRAIRSALDRIGEHSPRR